MRGFPAGVDLPERWRGRRGFVVLETGFGLGDNFLACWRAWREDEARPERLVYLAIEPHPPGRDDLVRAHRERAWPPALADALIACWPPATPDLHCLAFDDGRVELLLAFGTLRGWLPELVAEVDAFLLPHDATSTDRAAGSDRVCKALARLAAPGATLVSDSTADTLAHDLRSAGFVVRHSVDAEGRPETTLARYDPSFVPRRAVARVTHLAREAPVERHALIVGAGLAGCAAADALAAQGWRSTLLDRAPRLASGASGNPAGLFHGVVHAADGPHTRFNRSASFHAAASIGAALADGVPGRCDGLLRLERTLSSEKMQALLDRLQLPPDHVRALAAPEASALAGIELRDPAWFYPRGGWVDPAALAGWFVARSGSATTWRPGSDIDRLEHHGAGWRLLDAAGDTIAEAPVVILANAEGAARLLERLGADRAPVIGTDAVPWPAESRRGQLTIAAADRLPALLRPVAGDGYLLPPSRGRVCFGATSRPDDPDPAVRLDDQLANLARLARLLGHDVDLAPASLEGRTAWRYAAADRLPLVGAVPDLSAPGPRRDQTRFVPRRPGLFVLTGLGSRGITWSTLAARVLAGWVTGAPMPVEASLLDGIDPARFVRRAARAASAR